MEVEVTIMSGAGNIFSVIDNREYKFSDIQLSSLAPQICSQSFKKKKTEGLIVINEMSKDTSVDFSALFFNPDGTNGMMCGNGGRCAVFYAINNKIISKKLSSINFIIANQIYSAEITDNLISIKFPPPIFIEKDLRLSVENFNVSGDFIDSGSPHFVIFFETLPYLNESFHTFDVVTLGSKIRFHKKFQTSGTNVDFVYLDREKVFVRTYERGVEDETGACGTGALSVGFDLFNRKFFNFPIKIIPKSGEELIIDAKFENDAIKNLYLIGRAEVLEINKIKIEPHYVLSPKG
ncbi:MAG: diaminopimelate epimerase [Candidatus Kapaibacteriales bacterium]